MNTSDNPSSLESREVSLMYKKGNPSVKKKQQQNKEKNYRPRAKHFEVKGLTHTLAINI